MSWLPTGSMHAEQNTPLECFPEGLLGNDSSMECVDVCRTFSKLLLTLLMGVSDLGATWKEKKNKPQTFSKINGGNEQPSYLPQAGAEHRRFPLLNPRGVIDIPQVTV